MMPLASYQLSVIVLSDYIGYIIIIIYWEYGWVYSIIWVHIYYWVCLGMPWVGMVGYILYGWVYSIIWVHIQYLGMVGYILYGWVCSIIWAHI